MSQPVSHDDYSFGQKCGNTGTGVHTLIACHRHAILVSLWSCQVTCSLQTSNFLRKKIFLLTNLNVTLM